VSYSCVKDEGGPLGIGFQERVPNHSKLLRPKSVVVSVGAKVRGMTPSRCVSGRRTKVNGVANKSVASEGCESSYHQLPGLDG
jgi:hypothetical protein